MVGRPRFEAQICWLVVMKSFVMGRDNEQIFRDLRPTGPSIRTIQTILQRFRTGMPVTGAGRGLGVANALSGDRLALLMRIVLHNPVLFLSEIQQGLFRIDDRLISVPAICQALRDLGLTRRKLYTLSVNYCEWKRTDFWRDYHNGHAAVHGREWRHKARRYAALPAPLAGWGGAG